MCRYLPNRHRKSVPTWDTATEAAFSAADIPDLHDSIPEYRPTPLLDLPTLARALGVGRIAVKDESHRFGPKAFKALGATYAVYRFLAGEAARRNATMPPVRQFYRRPGSVPPGRFTFCTATDGNHGRGVAWTARKLRQHAVVFVPGNTVAARVEVIRSEGARVVLVDGDYDAAVESAQREAARQGWQVISDTSWSGYEEIPRWIMAGYLTIFREIDRMREPGPPFDVVLIQGGVGALAAAAAWYYEREAHSRGTRLVSVEPADADCLMTSAQSDWGEATPCRGKQRSIMAGLNCGTPSLVAWPLIRDRYDGFLAISDNFCRKAMRQLAHPLPPDPRVVSGESGAAGLAGLLALVESRFCAEAREHLGMSGTSRVLVISTEGDTDPLSFMQITAAVQSPA